MLSYGHEVLVEMFRDRPALAAELLTGPLGVSVPAFEQARVSAADLTDLAPTEYRADAVVTLMVGDTPVLGVVVEAQLSDDGRKRWAWPPYVANLYARLKCPVELLVVSPDPAAAAWCSTPIAVNGSGFVLTPQVLGPAEVPVVTNPDLARRQAPAGGALGGDARRAVRPAGGLRRTAGRVGSCRSRSCRPVC